ncbi:unnamed protein product [Ascophyllum nodosum]
MAISDDNNELLEEFEEPLNDEANQGQMESERNAADPLNIFLQAPDATDYSNARLIEELEIRNARISGFRDQDLLTLQKFLNQEFEVEKESILKHQREKREQAAKQAGLQRKRMMLEKQLREEISEIEKDDRIEFWLTLVKQNSTPLSARIEVNSITARALAKAMWTNTSLTSLDLSCSGIDDQAGAYIARLLKRNTALGTLSLGSNQLGTSACRAFGDSLCSNTTLRSLSLESNRLTQHGADSSGVQALADMLGKNNTLISINLWRCALGAEAGTALTRGIESNHTITFLEVGHNGLAVADQCQIKAALDANIQRFEQLQEVRRHEQGIADMILARENALKHQLRAERELREWLEQQKQLRAEERRKTEENRSAMT